MSEYYWDTQIEYLRNTRWLYYNDDYLEFLVQKVWNIQKPVNVVDYGCGYGYLGLKLLPLLPEGSTYTGIDKGQDLIDEAKELFSRLPYTTEFIVADLEEQSVDGKYDIAMSHAFLLHIAEPSIILQRMIDSVVDSGRVICFEPHWISNMSNYYFEGQEQSDIIQLGILQRLFEADRRSKSKDGNIGMRLPVLLSQLGLQDVQCRVSDRVNFLDQHMDLDMKNKLFEALSADGLGQDPGDDKQVEINLIERGLTAEGARRQYDAERLFSKQFNDQSWLTYAPNMKISFGIVNR
ncbi:methyltransferase [Paenibacillus sp. FSL H7-0326]|uniref:class I SAM-dependent methyltransferase n=1 Tax=Paenibacillus sp. FSL H7-0326 TaxID=1921144 RepID=UPI00096CAB42|nr:class I SAM-dependent methyltransferase [Paenibacillus sp. FSL H7-0326]OMC71754.1 methyltransferase [Paenibacillus sp. FSL H7-0326]